MISEDRMYRKFELRALEEGGKVEGYAAVVEAETVMYVDEYSGIEYKEVIDTNAFTNTDMTDVVMNYNHKGKVVARTKNGSLTLAVDAHGLLINADLTGSEEARKLYEEIKSGLIDKMSFAFTVKEEAYDRESHTRRILAIDRIYDVAAVDMPAYEQTELQARSYFTAEAAKEAAEAAEAKAEAEERARKEAEERAKVAEAEEARAAEIAKVIDESPVRKFEEKVEEKRMFTIDSVEYRNAWLKVMSGKAVTADERAALEEYRSGESLTADTATAGYAVPTITANKIVEELTQLYPLIGEIDLMQVPGNLSIAVESTVNAASIHTENAAITAADDVLTHITLSGYEIVKLLSVSAKLNAMAIDAFEAWIVSNLTRKIGEVIENYIVNGTGSSQPKGIDKYATWSDGTNAVDWASTSPTAAEIIEQIGLLNAAYVTTAKFLMNWKTFWNKVYGLRDDKNPAVVSDGQGGYRVFGFPVIISSKVDDDDIFFGDFKGGIVGNMAAPIAVESNTASGFRYNSVDYRGTCIFDCTTVGTGHIVKSAPTL